MGVGLLGGSLGLALKRRGLAGQVHGFVRRATSVSECLALGVVDRCSRNLAESVADADLVVLCSPVGQMPGLFQEMSRHLSPDCLVTDVGSVKTALARAVTDSRFVAGHPMAGSELDGLDGADAEMFVGAVWVLTPTANTSDDAFATVAAAVSVRLTTVEPSGSTVTPAVLRE